ncbi:xanthine dehydrogenase small subunit [Lentilitoribacter sp. Alg239-R112]|uniref:xanthine dehydrogenase small subunit n=1 Tax=Lentilitoribacter sp. Alg239-R112 TaxID=2305987 RepID=UPI0013A699CA|nr:xanthine dehydrogenase small subunit [Lentilitoribacter sp. Alg239-R112]
MPKTRDHINFLLNDKSVRLTDIPASATLLDYLRLEQRLRGTKEGCAEGDCGACTVLVGRISNDRLIYETVNSCIRFLGSLDGCHIVTIEHLKKSDGSLHPVQQAMVDHHGSQCGFCTPGIVMSLYALWMENPTPSNQEIEIALQGNLCRCTGYEPIIHAAQAISSIDTPENDPLKTERDEIKNRLKSFNDNARVDIKFEEEHFIVPASLDDFADARVKYPNSTIVAGSTDVGLWVTKNMRPITPAIFISNLDELQKINVSASQISIGAGVTYNDMQDVVEKHIPQLKGFWNRIGGMQVRNMGTVGGNIANGSPIGDTPPALIALGAELRLRCGGKQRSLPIESFFIDYGKQDRKTGDFLEQINIPIPDPSDFFAVYKISKRRDEDISALCGAFKVRISNGMISDAKIAFGGMAATPKRATNVEKKLIGKSWSMDTISTSMVFFEEDYAPLSDWRASSDYRMLVAKNLLLRFFKEMTSEGEQHQLTREAVLEGLA